MRTFKQICCLINLSLALWLPDYALAEDWPLADSNLKSCIEKLAKKQGWLQMQQVTEVRCHSQGIESLVGLNQFKNIKILSLHNNNIVDIDLIAWPLLEELNVAKNKLKQLAIINLTQLKQFYAFSNQIEDLRLDDLPSLEQFKANNNGMKTFHYQNLPTVNKIYLFDNELETMDIYQLPALKYLDVRQNPMPDELYEEMDRLKGVTVLHDGNAEDWQ